jgi:hypothetical protein
LLKKYTSRDTIPWVFKDSVSKLLEVGTQLTTAGIKIYYAAGFKDKKEVFL